MNTEETITITKKEYEELRDSEWMLRCLESESVDNWTGNELLEQINRFRNLKEKVGASKMSSFSVELYFDPDTDDVTVTFGTYDIGDLPRHDILRTSQKRLVKDMRFQISIYENIIKNDDSETT